MRVNALLNNRPLIVAQNAPPPGPRMPPRRPVKQKLPEPVKPEPVKPESKRKSVWPPTDEPVIRWWDDTMQNNLRAPGAQKWLGRAQVAMSPLAVLLLGPVESLLVVLRQSGPKRG